MKVISRQVRNITMYLHTKTDRLTHRNQRNLRGSLLWKGEFTAFLWTIANVNRNMVRLILTQESISQTKTEKELIKEQMTELHVCK